MHTRRSNRGLRRLFVRACSMGGGVLLAVGIGGAGGCADKQVVTEGWSAIGGLHETGEVNTVVWWDPDGAGPRGAMVVVGGEFKSVGGVKATNIAAWDPERQAWTGMGDDLRARVRTLVVSPTNELYAGGDFSSLTAKEPLSGNGVAKWTGDRWVAAAPGLAQSRGNDVFALAFMPNGDLVAAGGMFGREASRGPSVPNYLARWNGKEWSAIGGGVNGTVLGMTALPAGDLVVAGRFTKAGDIAVNHVARWSEANGWSALGTGTDGAYVRAVDVTPGGDLIFGGEFTRAGDVSATNVAVWSERTRTWSSFGEGLSGPGGFVRTVMALPNGDVLAGGDFVKSGGMDVPHLARWDHERRTWSSLGGGTDGVVREVVERPGGGWIAVGEFTKAGDATAGGIAAYESTDGRSGSWRELGSTNNVYIGACDVRADGRLIVGGTFSGAGDTKAVNLAEWDPATERWSAFGTDVLNSDVSAITALPNGDVLIGGPFTAIGETAARRVARWDGSKWSAIGEGIGGAQVGGVGTINAILASPAGALAAAGSFTLVDGGGSRTMATWDGTRWLSPASEKRERDRVTQLVSVPLKAHDGESVIGWGMFPSVFQQVFEPGEPVSNFVQECVARWNGGAWESVNMKMDGKPFGSPWVSGAAVLPNGRVVIGGAFGEVRGVPARAVVEWSPTDDTVRALGDGLERPVRALAALPDGGVVVASGGFGWAACRLFRWDGTAWQDLHASTDGPVQYMAAVPAKGSDGPVKGAVDVLIVGSFTTVGVVTAEGQAASTISSPNVARFRLVEGRKR